MQAVELQIEDVAFGGKGVGRLNGKAVFVPFTIEGERVAARIARAKKQFAEADLEEVLEPAAQRVAPACPYFGRCGGCSYQHMNYEHQLAVKQRQVEQIMRRIGRFTDLPMRPIIPSPKPYEYRNRITVHCEDGVVGYYRRDVHQLIDVERCPIARPEVNAALNELRARRPRDGHYTLRADSGPRVFSQTNDEVAEALAALLESQLPARQELLIDAYCGAGFFTKRLRDKFERVIGIEWDRFAIAVAQKEVVPNESYISGDVELELPKLLKERRVEAAVSAAPQAENAGGTPATTVIVDPPATGLSVSIRRTLLDHPPATLLYVSCNLATLARDLSELRTSFSIESITPLDMFPQTAEIEVAAHLRTGS